MPLNLTTRLGLTNLKERISVRRFYIPSCHSTVPTSLYIHMLFQDFIHKYPVAEWLFLLKQPHNEIASHCFVHELKFCKGSSGPEHDFVLAYICHPNPSTSIRSVMKIERVVDADLCQAWKDLKKENGNEQEDPRETSAQLLASIGVASRDLITVVQEVEERTVLMAAQPYDECFGTITYPRGIGTSTPRVYHLSILAGIVGIHYKPHGSQYYRFARTLWESMCKLFPATESTDNGGASERSEQGVLPVVVDSDADEVCEKFWSTIQEQKEEEKNRLEAHDRELIQQAWQQGLQEGREEGQKLGRQRIQDEIDRLRQDIEQLQRQHQEDMDQFRQGRE